MVGRINETRSAFDNLTKMYCCFKRFPVDSGYAFNKVLLNNIISLLVTLPKILRDTNQPLFKCVCKNILIVNFKERFYEASNLLTLPTIYRC